MSGLLRIMKEVWGMEKEQCRLCGNQLEYVFSHFVLEKYKVNYNKYIFSYVNMAMTSRTMSDHQIRLKSAGI